MKQSTWQHLKYQTAHVSFTVSLVTRILFKNRRRQFTYHQNPLESVLFYIKSCIHYYT